MGGLFEERRRWGWPPIEWSDADDLAAKLAALGLKAFVTSASYGLSGFVLAERMELVGRPSRAVFPDI